MSSLLSTATASIRARGLPLLAKELIEQAVSRRTYVIRSVYASLLFIFALYTFNQELQRGSGNVYQLLGKGRVMFVNLAWVQTIGILMFTPALTCGAITSEKERNTFGLLMLTRLGPWTIVLEKYLGRLVTMGSYLLLSVPLLGFCYCYGGLQQGEVLCGILSLAVTICQVGAIGICCSAYCRTTVSAFLATYVTTFLLVLSPLFVYSTFRVNILQGPADLYAAMATGAGWAITDALKAVTLLFGFNSQWINDWMPRQEIQLTVAEYPALFFAPGNAILISSPFSQAPTWHRLAMTFPALLSAAGFLVLARFFVIRRAFVPARNLLLKLFRGLDHLFYRLNHNRVTRGIVIINDSQSLPGEDPIAWRETSKKSLGTIRYLIRVLLVMEFPTLTVCLTAIIFNAGTYFVYYRPHPAISVVTSVTWIMAVLFVAVKASTLVAGERSSETLDVLLSTPIDSRELVRQKFQGIVRLMLVVATPLMTAIIMQTWFGVATRGFLGGSSSGSLVGVTGLSLGMEALLRALVVTGVVVSAVYWWKGRDWLWLSYGLILGVLLCAGLEMPSLTQNAGREVLRVPLAYFLLQTASVVVYFPLIAWVSFYVGLRMKTQTRAIFASLALLVVWCVAPILLMIAMWSMFRLNGVGPGESIVGFLLLLSPATVPFFLEVGAAGEVLGDPVWFRANINFLFYAGLTLAIRRHVFEAAPVILGRLHNEHPPHRWKRVYREDTVVLVPEGSD